MDDDVLQLLKVHDYFRDVPEEALRDVADAGEVAHHEPGAVLHQPGEPLASVCFVLRGRLKAVRIDEQGAEQPFRTIDRGDQYGLMLGAIGEAVPVRIFALEPTTVLNLDYERSLDLTLKHPELRKHWLKTYARGLQRHFFETVSDRTPGVLAILHESDATRPLAQKLVERLRGIGEDVRVMADAEAWRPVPGGAFRALVDGGRSLEVSELRQQIAEWHKARRIVIDVAASRDRELTERLVGFADRVLVFARSGEGGAVVERLRSLDTQARGRRDKTSVVWLLEEGTSVAPAVPQLADLAGRDFKVATGEVKSPWGRALANGLERLVHYLRGVRIGIALGGGAARGMSHLGVLKALEQNGIVVDEIAGTSAGAMTGVIYSSGLDGDYCAGQFAGDLKLPWIFRRLPSGDYWYLLYKYRRGHFDPMLRKYLRDWKLEQLPVPCRTVTVDLVGGCSVVRSQGDAVHAILESINLPGLSLPICRDGQALIDGGLVNNIPADVLTAAGCNFVIAVSVTAKIEHRFGKNTPDTPTPSMKRPSTIRTLFRSLVVQNYNLNDFGVRGADVVIAPDVTGFELSEFMRAKELAAVGERTALEAVPKIQQLLARLDPALFRFGT